MRKISDEEKEVKRERVIGIVEREEEKKVIEGDKSVSIKEIAAGRVTVDMIVNIKEMTIKMTANVMIVPEKKVEVPGKEMRIQKEPAVQGRLMKNERRIEN